MQPYKAKDGAVQARHACVNALLDEQMSLVRNPPPYCDHVAVLLNNLAEGHDIWTLAFQMLLDLLLPFAL
ncbi:hypothetical protein D3C75_1122830 [compost metagenome]